LDPEDLWARLRIAEIYTMTGKYEEAFREYERAKVGNGGSYRLGYAYAVSGRVEDARRMIASVTASEHTTSPDSDCLLATRTTLFKHWIESGET